MPVALVQTGMTQSFETTPVVDHKMKVMALSGATGAPIWETTYNLGSFKICCAPVNRGVAVAYGNVYFLTTVADPNVGYSETMTPQVYKNHVVIGSAGGEWAIRGYVAPYDAMSGKQQWR